MVFILKPIGLLPELWLFSSLGQLTFLFFLAVLDSFFLVSLSRGYCRCSPKHTQQPGVADSSQERFEEGVDVSRLAVYIKSTGAGGPVTMTSQTLRSPRAWLETSSPTEMLLELEWLLWQSCLQFSGLAWQCTRGVRVSLGSCSQASGNLPASAPQPWLMRWSLYKVLSYEGWENPWQQRSCIPGRIPWLEPPLSEMERIYAEQYIAGSQREVMTWKLITL